jgi:hypothetical protein
VNVISASNSINSVVRAFNMELRCVAQCVGRGAPVAGTFDLRDVEEAATALSGILFAVEAMLQLLSIVAANLRVEK